MDTKDVQVGLAKLEVKVEGLQKAVETGNKNILTSIENAVLKGFEVHMEKKHKALDLKTLIPFLIVSGTAIGAMVLALLG